jgi:hypothetical protein
MASSAAASIPASATSTDGSMPGSIQIGSVGVPSTTGRPSRYSGHSEPTCRVNADGAHR